MQDSEYLLQQWVQQSLIEISIVDVDTFKFFYANNATLENLGYSLEELENLTPFDVINSQQPQIEMAKLVELTRLINEGDINTPFTFNTTIRRKDNSLYPAQIHLQKIKYEEKEAIAATVQDISEQQRIMDQMSAVIDGGVIGYWDRNLETNEEYVNDKWLEMIGFSREELTEDGINIFVNRIHPDDRELGERAVEECLREGKPYLIEFRMQHKDGHWVWIQGSGAVVGWNEESGKAARMCGVHLDVTKRKLEELEKEKYFRFFVVSSDLLMIGDENGHLHEVNPSTLSTLGYTEEEILAIPIFDLFHPDDLEKTTKFSEKVLQGEALLEIENRMRCKDGSYIWVSWRAVYDKENKTAYAQARNIDAQKHISEELKKKEKKYQVLAENTVDLILQYDSEFRVLYANPVVNVVLGKTPEDMIGRTRREAGEPEELCDIWEEVIDKVFKTGKTEYLTFEMDAGRGLRSLDWRVFPELDDDGNVESVFSVSRDVTKMKQMEEEQQKSQKLASLGVLAGGIAHDFNNILTILFGNVSLARQLLPEDNEAVEVLEQAEEAYHRATQLTSQLLTFAKGGDPVRTNTNIFDLVKDVVDFDLSGSNVKLELDLPEDLWHADIDKSQISQVFSNLTINANEAMPGGGRIYISARNYEVEKREILGLRSGKYIQFVIRDEGEGIPKKDLNKVFDPYFSTKQTGSGLGLATVFSVVQKHGGIINVQSDPAEGTIFEFFLPASDSEAAVIEPLENNYEKKLSSKGRILIMDDEEMICEVTRSLLEVDGFEVDTVDDGSKAVAYCSKALYEGNPYDCIIMDLTVPGGVGGAEAIKDILALDSEANVVVSSGYAVDPVMANYSDYGFKGCLTKPFNMASLREVIQQARET